MVRAFALGLIIAGCGRIGFSVVPDSDLGTGKLVYRAAVLEDSPIGYWRLGDPAATAVDETGRVDGAYVGMCQHGVAGALAADPNAAVRLDGATCEVTLGNNFIFANNAPFTVELWLATGPKTGYTIYFAMETRTGGGAGNPVDGYALFKGSPPVLVAERVVSGTVVDTPGQMVPAEPWIYLVYTYDGAALALYVDAGSPQLVADARPMPSFTSVALIGAHTQGDFADGILDEVAVYDYVLPAARMALHHQIGLSGPQ
jgi:hypothetical protein